MTLVTGGESPKHSKWHLITGTVMLLGAFVVTMFAIEHHLRPDEVPGMPELSKHQAPSPAPSAPTDIRVASRD